MRKLITISLAVLLTGLFAAVVYAAVQSGDDTASTGTVTTETTETTATSQHREREREREQRHRERERGDNRREDRRDDRRADDAPATGAVDVSGPCDEVEHANDPRCTGAVAPRVEDNQRADDDPVGHDVGDDHGADDRVDDRGGEVEDHSGPGRGGDDRGGDDNSGPGHGGGDHGGRDHEEDD